MMGKSKGKSKLRSKSKKNTSSNLIIKEIKIEHFIVDIIYELNEDNISNETKEKRYSELQQVPFDFLTVIEIIVERYTCKPSLILDLVKILSKIYEERVKTKLSNLEEQYDELSRYYYKMVARDYPEKK